MKLGTTLLWCFFASLPVGTPSVQAASTSAGGTTQPASAVGVVEGRVFDAATGAALGKVRVALEGTNQEAVTDDSGSYRLTAVPAGAARISAIYLGLNRQTVTVNVTPGGVVQREFELTRGVERPQAEAEIVRLQEFNVVADREMSAQAIAINEQRLAPNLKNVVAIDEYGDKGTETVMNFLQFVPGVAVADDAVAAGSISLRGFPDTQSIVQIDGSNFSSSRTANTRAVVLIEVPMANISRVELTKVPTPDMPASGLGGSINLISKTGAEVQRPQGTYQISQLFTNRTGLTFNGGPINEIPSASPKYIQPSYNLSYLFPVNKSLAFSAAIDRTWRFKPKMRDNDSDETSAWNQVLLVQTTSTWQDLAQVIATASAQLGANWRITATDTVDLSFNFREVANITTRQNFVAAYGSGVTGNATYSQGAATAVGTVTQENQTWSDKPNNNRHFTAKYSHKGDVWRYNAAGSISSARGHFRDVDDGFFGTAASSITGLVLRGDGRPAQGGNLPTVYSATTAAGVPVNVYDGGNYSLNSVVSDQLHNITTQTNGRADLARDFGGTVPITIKLGIERSEMVRDETRHTMTFDFRPNGASDVTSRLAKNFDVFDDAFIAVAPTMYGKPVRWISNPKVYQLSLQHPDWFVLQAPAAFQSQVNNSRKFDEIVSAGYVRADLRLLQNKLWIVTGVRMERTTTGGWGPLVDPTAIYQKTAGGSFVLDATGKKILLTTDSLAQTKLQYIMRGAHSTQNYQGYYPSLNATYNLAENFLFRAAYARTIGRPDVSSVVPGVTITSPDAANPTISVRNQALKPWTADNYDLSLESYFFKDGVGSLGVFEKDLNGFFVPVTTPATAALLQAYGLPSDPSYLNNYSIVTTTNGGDAKVTGLEFGYRQSLTFLPDWARGFQIYANTSKLHLGGTHAADLVGFTPYTYSAGINLIRPRFFIKMNVIRQGDSRRSLVAASASVAPDTYQYLTARTKWAINAQYSLTKRYSLFLSSNDIGGGVFATSQYAPGTPNFAKPLRVQEDVYYTTIGIKGQF